MDFFFKNFKNAKWKRNIKIPNRHWKNSKWWKVKLLFQSAKKEQWKKYSYSESSLIKKWKCFKWRD